MKSEKALIKIIHTLQRIEDKLDKVGENLGLEFEEHTNIVDPPKPNKKPKLTHEQVAALKAEQEPAPVPEPVVEEKEEESDGEEVEELPEITNN